MKTDSLRHFGRRLRLGMVGGGIDSVVGEAHRIALQADGFFSLVAGCFAKEPEIADQTASGLLIDADRRYVSYQEMAEREAGRDDGIDAVVIATPPNLHRDMVMAFLDRGIDIICEKPLTVTLAEAVSLKDAVDRSDRIFVLTHCYAGYPMVRQARDMVRGGQIGQIRMMESEFMIGTPGAVRDPDDPDRRHWRFRSDVVGKTAIVGEIGSHAYHLMHYVGGKLPVRLSAQMQTFAEGREAYDNAYLTFVYEDGATARLWASYAATGVKHGLRLRVYGDDASFEWSHEDAEFLHVRPLEGPEYRHRAGESGLADWVAGSARFRPGHPEGYPLAFANLYVDAAHAILARRLGEDPAPFLRNLPGVEDGINHMRMIDAAIRSNEAGGAWVAL